ncbi:MAG TPA: hypothetical protein PKO25_09045 [Spirochaetota bacterium]|jgi:hypothetical protein|nr:hypothetical protein [Spirochaetota bacterium]OPZ38128.1 MAG: hypothetical protein BWY96_01294 [Spirochaetes bacterium ADurb.BinA120]HNU92006.1 hypothetical protein [Spirochaetota bacterium]HPI15261.1 hypothetical protein [Spirochaetota bacterium]HPO44656.1 hypothetical protein [Spirochaetota bacterium]
MSEEIVIKHLREMEERIMAGIEKIRAEILEEMETNLMEIGVYKKEILEKLKGGSRSTKNNNSK